MPNQRKSKELGSDDDLLHSKKELAGFLKTCPRTLRSRMKKDKPPRHVLPSGAIYWLKSEILNWIKAFPPEKVGRASSAKHSPR